MRFFSMRKWAFCATQRLSFLCLIACASAWLGALTPGKTETGPTTAPAAIPAFPGAQGAGANTIGGRFGSVYRVTNLNASGPGSFADAVSQPNRIVVFTVSGIIDLSGGKEGKRGKILVDQPHITIAGQTAPGEGICLKNGGMEIKAGDVIVRYIRSRRGFIHDSDAGDAFDIKPEKTEVAKSGAGTTSEHFEKVLEKKKSRGKVMKEPARIDNILLDHLSASWATDENLTVTHANNTTVQYCIAAEGLDYSNPKQTPPNHSEGSLWGVAVPDGRSTMHHMLYAHNRLRNPRTTGGSDPPAVLEFFDSVIYDCSEYTSATGGESVHLNWLNNYYKPGPSTPDALKPVMFTFVHSPDSRMFASGNLIDGFASGSEDNWLAVRFEKGLSPSDGKKMRMDKPFDLPAINKQSAQDAYETVLNESGAILPARDSVDFRIVTSVREGTGKVIKKETDLAPEDRWPDYHTLPAPKDSVGNGLPDFWKDQFGIDKTDAASAMKITAGGYANIEHYFNNTDPTGGTTPIVYAYASVSRAGCGKNQVGEIVLARAGDDSADLPVKYHLAGNAKAGEDYVELDGKVTIPAHKRTVAIKVTPNAQAAESDGKTVVIDLDVHSTGYHVGCPSAAMVVFHK